MNAKVRWLFVILMAAGIVAGLSVDFASDAQGSSVLPHLVWLAALAAGVSGIAAIIGSISKSKSARAIVFLIGFSVFSCLSLFYVALSFTLNFLGELPTRHLVAGYWRDLPAIFIAAPLTLPLRLALALIVCVTLAVAGVLAGRYLTLVAANAPIAISSSRRAAVVRIATYPCLLFVASTFFTIPSWQIEAREPIASSWHNVSLRKDALPRELGAEEWAFDQQARTAIRDQPRPARRPNVIVIYVDALRADVTEPYGGQHSRSNMPFMTRMVRTGVFTQVNMALAACNGTVCGLAALLQSRPTWKQHPDFLSLPKLLKEVGYSTAYVLSSNHQDYLNLKNFYEPADFYLDGKDIDPGAGLDDRVVLEGLRRLGPWKGTPTFLMVGLVSPHSLAKRDKAFRHFLPDHEAPGDATFKERYRNHYHNGVLQADAVLKSTWDALADGGYLANSIVVITADHGESLGEKGYTGHMTSLDHAELRIPLWIYETHKTVGITRFARQIDIAPTVVAALGMNIPATWQGLPLQEPLSNVFSEHYSSHLRDKIAFVHYDGETAIKLNFDRATTAEQAYELFADPNEQHNLIDAVDRNRLRRLQALVRARFDNLPSWRTAKSSEGVAKSPERH